jgi:YhcH/YjgK/YiaL family protein
VIHDSLNNWNQYFKGQLAARIKREINSAMTMSETFEKVVIPEKLVIRTLNYSLFSDKSTNLIIESHKHWIDIQFSIIHSERIDIFEPQNLTELDYDAENDMITYLNGASPPIVTVVNHPGKFSMIFPEEAHRPMMQCGGVNSILKGVVKLSSDLFYRMNPGANIRENKGTHS